MNVHSIQYNIIRDAVMESLVSDQIDLPLLPQVAAQLLQMTYANQANAQKFADVVHQDQLLAGYVLRVVNSSTFARRAEVKSLKQAVTLLGISFLKDIAVACALGTRVFKAPGQMALISRMWRHALASAHFAKELDELAQSGENSAYLCGLLHEIGKPLALKSMIDIATELGLRLDERLVAGLIDETHLSFGKLLAQRWQLPEWVAACIEHHQDPIPATHFAYEVSVAHAACCCASLLEQGNCTEAVLLGEPSLEVLGLDQRKIHQLSGRISDICSIIKEAPF